MEFIESQRNRHDYIGTASYEWNQPTEKARVTKKPIFYALIGAVAGIVYFIIGPLATLIKGSSISCASPTINFGGLPLGEFPPEVSECVAQRAAPFVLQWIFNLILYSMFVVFMSIDRRAKHLSAQQAAQIGVAMRAYCIGGPFVTLILALALDRFSTNYSTVSVQLSRQAIVCFVRLPLVAEWVWCMCLTF